MYLFKLIRLKMLRKTLQLPVFVVGSSHSGTSIMLRILSENVDLHGIKNETRLFYKNNSEIVSTLLEWMSDVEKLEKMGFVEKTPGHILCVDKIFHYLPHTKIICMLRDGRDVACSIKARLGGTSDGFKRGLDVWIDSYNVYKVYLSDPRFKFVKLEELVENPTVTIQSICQFLGITYKQYMLDYHRHEKNFYSDIIEHSDNVLDGDGHLKNRNWQINQPLFKNTSRWKNELTQEEKNLIKELAQDKLERLGYENSPNW